jgi:DNA topoisomerase VI subunit A
MSRQGQGAKAYARLFLVVQISYELLNLEKSSSQRDVYYRCKNISCALLEMWGSLQEKAGLYVLLLVSQCVDDGVSSRLKTLDIFNTAEHVNQAIQEVASMLKLPSSALGFCCCSRGAVYGPLLLQEDPGGIWVDCSQVPHSILGNARVMPSYGFQSSARCPTRESSASC